MQLIDMKVKDFIELLGSDAPAPGGGSASALSGAQGAALFVMVARLTVSKAKYVDFHQVCSDAIEKGEKLCSNLMDLIDRDTEAYNSVSAAYKMPKETDEEKAARSRAIEDATLLSTNVPFNTMQLGLEGLNVAKTLVCRSNPNTASDLGVAAQNLLSCVKGAWLNVLINLGGIKDEVSIEKFRSDGQAIIREASKLACDIFSVIEKSL